MSTIFDTHGLRQTVPAPALVILFRKFSAGFREWRARQRVQCTLSDLSDRELMDIGTTRGEIDYVASHRDFDPRGPRAVDRT
jgi:uncharacterized protein YjiS (DUF1127 family)